VTYIRKSANTAKLQRAKMLAEARERSDQAGDRKHVVDKRCEAINAFWAAKGYKINARAVETFPGSKRFFVRSNLRNGAPRGYVEKIRQAKEAALREANIHRLNARPY